MKTRRIFSLLIVFVFCVIITADGFAGENETGVYYLEPVVIYPSAIEECYANSLRNMKSIEYDSGAVEDSLKDVPFVDVQSRGPYGIQSDVQMRAATFEQTDVLIDGIKVNDPQTGHFNMDIPFSFFDIDKMTVVSGPAAGINAAGRQGGSVHVSIKKPQGKGVQANAVFGENNFQSQVVSVLYPFSSVNSRTTIGRSSSDGYRYNTDFDAINFSHISNIESGYGELDFKFGLLSKEFGANGFYSEFYPDQKEQTKTIFTSCGLKTETEGFYFYPQIYVRRHNDRFMLKKSNPAFYENIHISYVKGAKVDLMSEFCSGSLFSGIDTAVESIDSSNLGKRNRGRNIIYSTYTHKIDKWIASVGCTGYIYNGLKNRAAPDLGIGYSLTEKIKLRSACGQSFRAPTFTELYYQSPANIGNVNLSPERSNNYELGIDYDDQCFSSAVTVFKREEKDLIDWVRAPASTVYNIRNITRVDTEGVQVDFKLYPKDISGELESWEEIWFGYAFNDRDQKETGLISKYVFDYLKHKFTAGSKNLLPIGIVLSSDVIYQQRSNMGGDFIFNSSFKKKIKEYTLSLKIDNIFNNAYAQRSNIPMPGRSIFAGVEANW